MVRARYLAYRRALATLDRLSRDGLNEAEHELLCDAAQGMLLARDSTAEEARELRDAAAIALSLVVDEDRLSDKQADWVWWQIAACGPPDSRPTPRREGPMPLSGSVS
jgi:hypothetical protein